MKHLVSIQQWESHVAHKHVILDGDEIVAMYTLNYFQEPPCSLNGLWVAPDYRGRGIAKQILTEITKDKQPMSLLVHHSNWVDSLYRKFGFDYWCEDEDDSNYYWMKNFKDDNESI